MNRSFDDRVKYTVMPAADSRFVFVSNGHFPGRKGARVAWIRTDAAIVHAPCAHCGAAVNAPCVDDKGQAKTGTHAVRRRVAARRVRGSSDD